ncbi:hypothetical protein [Yoonia vestfoldensis]|uniref:Phage gp6-like head-tail connector protein n=1 Tax=Yoonia vestfoldensis TaxID=245188 RepID=A0A1Y0EH96_9RHOB|nr:hypothetical protein [Yoonia vestfoldensis]ARU02975.1 hypothetical protein LOKVESSMR4R_03709 [Yoonia vestfoldensis]
MRATSEIGAAVTPEEFRRAIHLEEPADDLTIAGYLSAAQEVVETACRRPLLPRDVIIETRYLGGSCWWFPVAPVQSLTTVAAQADDGSWTHLGTEGVVLLSAFDEPKLWIAEGYLADLRDGTALRVTASVGYLAGALRKGMCQAIIMLTKEWYDAGIALEQTDALKVSFGVERLIKQNRYKRPAEWGHG